MMNTLQLVQYYANLLILQYVGLPRAYATVLATATPLLMPQQTTQAITFSPTPTSGTFLLSYDGISTPTINWNDSAATIQTDLQTIPALSSVTVSGSIATGLLISFVGVIGVASMLQVPTNSLLASASRVLVTVTETDQTLPIAVQNAFDLSTAVGMQLDIIGKYAGVVRTINTPNGTLTLDDSDLLSLIRFAVLQNSSGSSLSTIESNMNLFFPGQFLIIDFKTMFMSYILSSSLGSTNLFTFLIQENLIPKPMGVGLNVIIVPTVTDLFGYRTYDLPNPVVTPFNNYASFNNTTWLYLSYAYVFYP